MQCQRKAVEEFLPFSVVGSLTNVLLKSDLPTAKYFTRVYFYDAEYKQVAWGQSCRFNLTSPIAPPPLVKGQPFKVLKTDSYGPGLIAAAASFSALSVALFVLLMTYDLVYKKKNV